MVSIPADGCTGSATGVKNAAGTTSLFFFFQIFAHHFRPFSGCERAGFSRFLLQAADKSILHRAAASLAAESRLTGVRKLPGSCAARERACLLTRHATATALFVPALLDLSWDVVI